MSKTSEDLEPNHFVRNFKILFIKGDDLLFKNPNLKFSLDSDQKILENKFNFIGEISGTKKLDMMMILSDDEMKSYIEDEKDPLPLYKQESVITCIENVDGEYQEVNPIKQGGVRFKPTKNDLMLLHGTPEWP